MPCNALELKQAYSLESAVKFSWSSVTGALHPERVETLRRYLKGKRILDAGCGGGAYVQYLLEQNFDAYGAEKNELFYGEAQRRVLDKKRIVKSDITRLDFPDKYFDTTYCFDVFEHLDDVAALRELARVTRERIIVTVPRENSELQPFGIAFATYTDLTHLRYYSPDSFYQLLSQIPHSSINIQDEIALDFKSIALSHLYCRFRFPLISWVFVKLLRFFIRNAEQKKRFAVILGVLNLP